MPGIVPALLKEDDEATQLNTIDPYADEDVNDFIVGYASESDGKYASESEEDDDKTQLNANDPHQFLKEDGELKYASESEEDDDKTQLNTMIHISF